MALSQHIVKLMGIPCKRKLFTDVQLLRCPGILNRRWRVHMHPGVNPWALLLHPLLERNALSQLLVTEQSFHLRAFEELFLDLRKPYNIHGALLVGVLKPA